MDALGTDPITDPATDPAIIYRFIGGYAGKYDDVTAYRSMVYRACHLQMLERDYAHANP